MVPVGPTLRFVPLNKSQPTIVDVVGTETAELSKPSLLQKGTALITEGLPMFLKLGRACNEKKDSVKSNLEV